MMICLCKIGRKIFKPANALHDLMDTISARLDSVWEGLSSFALLVTIIMNLVSDGISVPNVIGTLLEGFIAFYGTAIIVKIVEKIIEFINLMLFGFPNYIYTSCEKRCELEKARQSAIAEEIRKMEEEARRREAEEARRRAEVEARRKAREDARRREKEQEERLRRINRARIAEAIRMFNLKQGYSESDLKKAHRRLIKECHPDGHCGEEVCYTQKAQKINEAYERLKGTGQKAA